MTRPPVLRRITQIALVAHSVERTARRYWDAFGIGPWRFRTFDASSVTEMKIRGRRVDHAMRIAIARVGDIEWEIIEPLDDRSIYAEHLRAHGEGLHHIMFDVADYQQAAAHFRRSGCAEIQSGKWQGYRYAYFDTVASLGFVTEICSPPPDGAELPPPEHTYP